MKTLFLKWRSRIIAFASDFSMVPIAWLVAGWLGSNLELNFIAPQLIPFLICFQNIAFITCGLYRGMWRFASIPDLIRIVRSVVIGTCAIFLFFQFQGEKIPASIPFIYAMLLVLLLSGPRILFRWFRDYRRLFTKSQRVLIVGAGSAGEGIVRDLLRLPDKVYNPVAFVDDDPRKRGREIHGVRVIGKCQEIATLVVKLDIQLILIAVPSAASTDMRRIVTYCEQANIPFRTLPGLKDLAKGTVSINSLRPVSLEDLLGREQARLDWDKIHLAISNKRILVSGGGGSIGTELCRQIVNQAPSCLIIIDNNEYNLYTIDMELRKNFPSLNLYCLLCDVTDRLGCKKVFEQYNPEFVFHAAAYKHVPLLETQLRVAMFNNIIGTRVLAEVSSEFNVEKFVLISTDKAVNPTNIMGASKRASEIFCQNMNFHSTTKFITVRFGNVLDSAGSVVPLFRKQLNDGGPLTVTHPEITRFFMTIPEASQLILQAASMGEGGEIFVLDMGEPIKIRYLAEQLIMLSGKELGKDVEIQYTGLRPGEKLYEELFHEGEELCPTTHVKISQAKVRRREWAVLLDIFDAVEVACKRGDEKKLWECLYQLVPEYNTTHVSAINMFSVVYEKASEFPIACPVLNIAPEMMV